LNNPTISPAGWRRFALILVLSLLLVLISHQDSAAYWLEGGNPLCAAANHQSDVKIIPSTDGYWIVVWLDRRNGGDVDIYANKIDIDGNPLWGTSGVPVCTNGGLQRGARAISDGDGGAVIVWEDLTSGTDLYAQRIDTDGTTLWTSSGVAICTAASTQQYPELTTDGTGGAIIVWFDFRSTNYDVYAQRVDGNGNALWTTDGIAVCAKSYNQLGARLVTDGEGGAIITWTDRRSNTRNGIYAQRLDENGNELWTPGGVVVHYSTDYEQSTPDILADGTGGAIITWERGQPTTDYNIMINRISADSTLVWGSPITASAAPGDQRYPRITTDGAGGAIIIWEDWLYWPDNLDLAAQRVDFQGTVMWAANGVSVCSATGNQFEPLLCADGFGGAIFTWDDERLMDKDLYAQRIDASGTVMWATDGAVVTQMSEAQSIPSIAPDGKAGAIIAFHDYRDGVYVKAYAQRIERNGYWGYPAPHIAGVRDIPADEGGYVNLSWDASRLDPWPLMLISNYTVWRAISPAAAALQADAGAGIYLSAAEIDTESETPSILMQQYGAENYYWYLIGEVDPYHLPSYSMPTETMFDSTATSAEYHYFQVIAHTDDPAVFWISEPDSGYSVDNLAPCPPVALMAEQSFTPEGLLLTWDPGTEPDLYGYRIYRGESEGFPPGEGNLISAVTDTTTFDGDWTWETTYWYKVSAVDIHGNESEFTLLSPEQITGDDPEPIPLAAYIDQNWPNPFNPSTTIAFGLKRAGHTSLRIYDTAGRLVRVLVDEERPAGNYTEQWNGLDDRGSMVASGVYFYRLAAGSFLETRKMVLLR
jgi:hypothetical protein